VIDNEVWPVSGVGLGDSFPLPAIVLCCVEFASVGVNPNQLEDFGGIDAWGPSGGQLPLEGALEGTLSPYVILIGYPLNDVPQRVLGRVRSAWEVWLRRLLRRRLLVRRVIVCLLSFGWCSL